MINSSALEHALLLRKTGSFSQSARISGLTQSAISQQIAKLEKEIGILIFNRQTKPILLTSEGEKFLERAEDVVRQFNQLDDFAIQLATEIEGELKIGVMPTLAPYFTPLFINDLKRKYPKLQLVVEEAVTEEIVTGIMSGELNAGIFATPIKTKLKLNYEVLFYERFFGYVSDRHELTDKLKIDVKQLNSEDVWLLNTGNCFADQVKEVCRFKPSIDRNRALHYGTNSIDSLRAIVEHSGGVTFLPELAAMTVPSDREDLVKDLAGPHVAREISLVFAKGQPKMKLLEKMKEVMVSSIPSQMRKKGRKNLIHTGVVI